MTAALPTVEERLRKLEEQVIFLIDMLRSMEHEPSPLFVDDEELRRRINPKIGRDRFRALLLEQEKRGFPRIRTIWGGRYWPAVLAWLDSDNGVANNGINGNAEDGPENFDAPAQQVAWSQTRPRSPALLDSQAGRARSHGLPRSVHSAAAGR
jgi:hypothetical protein